MKAIVVNTCDEWQSYSSFNLVGVYPNRQHLNKVVRELIKEKVIDFDGTSVAKMTMEELQDNCTYINFNEITLNERE